MIELKLVAIGNQLGVALPEEVLRELHAGAGESIYLNTCSTAATGWPATMNRQLPGNC